MGLQRAVSAIDGADGGAAGDRVGMRVGVDTPHRHRVPLGLVLLAQGWITHPQLQTALEAQRASGQGRIGDWLTQSCGLPEERITRGLGVQWSCPVLGTDGIFAFSDGAGDAEAVCGGVWVGSAAGGWVVAAVCAFSGPDECSGGTGVWSR